MKNGAALLDIQLELKILSQIFSAVLLGLGFRKSVDKKGLNKN